MAATGKNYQHNKAVYGKLKVGDRVKFKRRLRPYSHWGIHIGDGKIVHMGGIGDPEKKKDAPRAESSFSIAGKLFSKAEVRVDDFWDVVNGDKASIDNSLDKKLSALDVQTIVRNATKRIGEVGYNLIYANCEHFTNWCRYDKCKSEQVEHALTGAALGCGAILGIMVVAGLAKAFGGDNESIEYDSD